MVIDSTHIFTAMNSLLVAYVSYTLKARRDRDKDVQKEVRALKEELIELKVTSVKEPRVRQIAEEVVKPLKEGQEEIRRDVKEI